MVYYSEELGCRILQFIMDCWRQRNGKVVPPKMGVQFNVLMVITCLTLLDRGDRLRCVTAHRSVLLAIQELFH